MDTPARHFTVDDNGSQRFLIDRYVDIDIDFDIVGDINVEFDTDDFGADIDFVENFVVIIIIIDQLIIIVIIMMM